MGGIKWRCEKSYLKPDERSWERRWMAWPKYYVLWGMKRRRMDEWQTRHLDHPHPDCGPSAGSAEWRHWWRSCRLSPSLTLVPWRKVCVYLLFDSPCTTLKNNTRTHTYRRGVRLVSLFSTVFSWLRVSRVNKTLTCVKVLMWCNCCCNQNGH